MSIQAINPDSLYTSEEVTEYLRVSLRTTQRLLKSGELASFKVHGQYRIKGLDILNYLSGVRTDSEEDLDDEKKPEALIPLLCVHPIAVEGSADIIPLMDPKQEGEILKRLPDIRKNITLDLGFIMPGIAFKDNLTLGKGEYNILIDGVKVASGKLETDKLFARPTRQDSEPISDCKIFDPIDNSNSVYWPVDKGNNAYWIDEELKEKAVNAGYEVITPADLLLLHIERIARNFAHEILNREEVSVIIDTVRKNYPVIVEELLESDSNDPYKLTIGELTKILKGLLYEQVSIRNIRLILEALADSLDIWRKSSPDTVTASEKGDVNFHSHQKDIDLLVELTRQKLSRQMCSKLANKDNVIDIIVLSEKVSQTFKESVHHTAQGNVLALKPDFSQKILLKVKELIADIKQPVILADPKARRYVKKLMARNFPNIVVLSYQEIDTMVKIRCVGTIDIEE